jgi:hypothetical protein
MRSQKLTVMCCKRGETRLNSKSRHVLVQKDRRNNPKWSLHIELTKSYTIDQQTVCRGQKKTTLFEVYITQNSTESGNLRYIKEGSVCSCKSSTAEKSTQPFNTNLFRTTLKSEFNTSNRTEICTYQKTQSTLFLQKGRLETRPIFYTTAVLYLWN